MANARNSAGDDEASSPPSDSPEYQNEEARQAAARLTEDILKGRIPPVLRRIRAARYGLDIDAIRRILKDLYDAGVLEADKRRSYKLSESAQNPFQETAQSEERNKKFGERSTGDWRAIRGRFRRLL